MLTTSLLREHRGNCNSHFGNWGLENAFQNGVFFKVLFLLPWTSKVGLNSFRIKLHNSKDRVKRALQNASFWSSMFSKMDISFLEPSYFQNNIYFQFLDPSHFSKMYITSLLYLTKNVSPRQKHVTKAKMRVLEEIFICRMPIGRCSI